MKISTPPFCCITPILYKLITCIVSAYNVLRLIHNSHTAPVTVKLWQPRHVKRTRRDLSELDVCLTLYDEVVREAMWVTGRISIIMLSSHEISKCACKSTPPDVNVWSTTGWSSRSDIDVRGCGDEVLDRTFTSGDVDMHAHLFIDHHCVSCSCCCCCCLRVKFSQLVLTVKLVIYSIEENVMYVCL